MVFYLITVVGHTDINWYTLYLYAFTYVLVLYRLKGMRCVRDIFSSTLITSKPHHEPNIWNHALPLYIFVAHIYRSQNITFIWWIAKSHISFFLQILWSSFTQFTPGSWNSPKMCTNMRQQKIQRGFLIFWNFSKWRQFLDPKWRF